MSQSPRKSLSLPVLHILLALAEGPRHGYAIKQEVETRTGGALRLGPSTLYEAIQRLEDADLVEPAAPSKTAEPSNGQEAQRRYYSLTPQGWRALQAELRQLDTLMSAARANPRLRKGLT